MPTNSAAGQIRNIFVLMLENRSFDHMLGFSGIAGTDAATSGPATINGLDGTQCNESATTAFPVTQPADFVMPVDPAHEFQNVLKQLTGGSAFTPGAAYPAINNSGFVLDYASIGGASNPGEIMKCYSPGQLPVLNALAREFAVCDNWFCSMPGPTWPNRFFVHAGSSGGLDHSPTGGEIAGWDIFSGFQFANGTLFNRITGLDSRTGWRIYAGGDFPNVAALKGVNNFEVNYLDDFANDLKGNYPWKYTFIEPNYGDVVSNTFRGGNSQHPLDDVTHGEALIKMVYEAIRNSAVWNNSLLILTWDEHGGFYDHVPPPAAPSPGDKSVTGGANASGFTFNQYGPRVPAVVVSPLIPKNRIDHRLYDHSSIPATVEAIFGLSPLTQRDGAANNLTSLASLSTARADAPMTLPNAAPLSVAAMVAAAAAPISPSAKSPAASIEGGNLPGFLHAAMKSDLALSSPEEQAAIMAQAPAIQTRAQAQAYMDKVRTKVQAARVASRHINMRNTP